MNYDKLFDLMSDHGLTLLEGEMDEIIITVFETVGIDYVHYANTGEVIKLKEK